MALGLAVPSGACCCCGTCRRCWAGRLSRCCRRRPRCSVPSPTMVASGEIWSNLHDQSGARVFTGFGIGLLAGLVLGSVMGLSPTARDYLYPLFKAFAQVPVIGWLPLLMLLVGIDEALKFLLIAKATPGAGHAQHLRGHSGRAQPLHRGGQGVWLQALADADQGGFSCRHSPDLERRALRPHPRLAGAGGGGAAGLVRRHRFPHRLWPPAVPARRGAGLGAGGGHRGLCHRQAAVAGRSLAAALAHARSCEQGEPPCHEHVL